MPKAKTSKTTSVKKRTTSRTSKAVKPVAKPAEKSVAKQQTHFSMTDNLEERSVRAIFVTIITLALVMPIFTIVVMVLVLDYQKELDMKFAAYESSTAKIISYLEEKNKDRVEASEPVIITRSVSFESAVSGANVALAQAEVAESVNLVIYGTECCTEPLSSENAASQIIGYIENAGDFSFDQSSDIVSSLRSADQRINEKAVGVSEEKAVIAYSVNEDGLVDSVYLNINYDLILE